MSLENEIKVRVADLQGFLDKLDEFDPLVLTERHFEDNFALDFPDRRLGSGQSLLRVRITPKTALLTYKGPPRPTGLFKTREELESAVATGPELLAILRKVGMRVWFRYQKYRREFRIFAGPRRTGEVHVALDETPIGNFAEFEGPGANIKRAARRMGFSQSQYLRDSYASLYFQFCRDRRRPVRNMTFRSMRTARVLPERKNPRAIRHIPKQTGRPWPAARKRKDKT